MVIWTIEGVRLSDISTVESSPSDGGPEASPAAPPLRSMLGVGVASGVGGGVGEASAVAVSTGGRGVGVPSTASNESGNDVVAGTGIGADSLVGVATVRVTVAPLPHAKADSSVSATRDAAK